MLILAFILTLIYVHALYNWNELPVLYRLLVALLQLTACVLVMPTFVSSLESPPNLESVGLALIFSAIYVFTLISLILLVASLIFSMVILTLHAHELVEKVVEPAFKQKNKDVVTFINRIFSK